MHALMLRRVLPGVGTGCVIAAVAISAKEAEPQEEPKKKYLRLADLPLYTEEPPPPKQEVKVDESKKKEEDSLLEGSVRSVRQELWKLVDQAKVVTDQAIVYATTAVAHSSGTIDYLREESNLLPRIGAIGVGALGGWVIGLRRGRITRLAYATLAASGMAALCYPTQVQEYTTIAIDNTKKYATIGYHFINGVSRDLTGYQLPALPGDHHLIISEGHHHHHHHHHHEPAEAVPSSADLMPLTAPTTHIPMPYDDEVKKTSTQKVKS